LQSLAGWVGSGVIDPIQMGLLVNQLSALLSISGEEVLAQLSRMRRLSVRQPAVSAHAAPARAADSEQQAIRHIVEVLLNEPRLYPSVSAYLDPQTIRSPELGLIAQQLISLIESGEEFTLGDLIGRFELPSFGALITDMQERGERRGQYEQVLTGAVACLMSVAQARETTKLAGQLRSPQPSASNEDEQLLALAASARHPHFASPRARKKFLES
jgi:hypothetical protein